MKVRIAVAVGAAITLGMIATPANAATLATSGTGWKIHTSEATSLSPTRANTITFSSTAVKNYWGPYLTRAVAQLKTAGLHIAIGGVETVAAGACPAIGHLHIKESFQPLGKPGYSNGHACHDLKTGAQTSGVVQMDSEVRAGTWTFSTTLKYNAVTHEALHALALDHPNYDKDKDGTVEDGECVATSYGNKPLMCSPSGGYQTTANRGKLLAYDVSGIKALINNAKLQGIK